MNITLKIQHGLLLLAVAVCLQNAEAAGQIDLVAGTVSVTSAAGQLRLAGKGERIEAGDAIVTGRDGEIQVHMDDNALIALRANTFLRIEAYKAEGGADDSAVFRLLRGSFRSITGWIGKNNPQKYAVRTSTATIGIRGTDHETLIVGEGDDAGTYDKVNTGETEMETPTGKVSILAGQAAFTPKTGSLPPKLLAAVPDLFVPSPHEAQIDTSKKMLEESRDERLKEKIRDNTRKGTDNNGKPQIGDLDDARKALAVFEDMLRALEAGNVALIRQRLDPAMIGYQQLLDGITQSTNECKQTRVTLLDTQVQAGPDIAVVQTRWEKRCLLLPAFTPQLVTGRSTILLHLGVNGWTFAAITPGNMFQRLVPAPLAPAAPATAPPVRGRAIPPGVGLDVAPAATLATLTVLNNSASYTAFPISSGPVVAQPFTIIVTDPDSAGAPFLNVVMTTTSAFANDTQVLKLLPIIPGDEQFTLRRVNFSRAASRCTSANTPTNPNALEICPNTTATITYLDTTTPSGSPQMLTQSAIIP